MALIGEEVVEEWLNRKGYFTIRGIKLGVHEIDLLAIKPSPNEFDCRHIEVQISNNPVAYITKVPKAIQKERGIGPDNAKERPITELKEGMREWIEKKFDDPRKEKLRQSLFRGKWTRELVVHIVRHEEELGLFTEAGIRVHRLKDIMKEITSKEGVIEAAAGDDLIRLILMGESVKAGPLVEGANLPPLKDEI